MCMASKSSPPPPPPAPEPVKPPKMVDKTYTPEDPKPRKGKQALRTDMSIGGTGNTSGLNIPT